jgi:hypothetical protein
VTNTLDHRIFLIHDRWEDGIPVGPVYKACLESRYKPIITAVESLGELREHVEAEAALSSPKYSFRDPEPPVYWFGFTGRPYERDDICDILDYVETLNRYQFVEYSRRFVTRWLPDNWFGGEQFLCPDLTSGESALEWLEAQL